MGSHRDLFLVAVSRLDTLLQTRMTSDFHSHARAFTAAVLKLYNLHFQSFTQAFNHTRIQE